MSDHTDSLNKSRDISEQVLTERLRQLGKWGEQHHSDGTGYRAYQEEAEHYKTYNDAVETCGLPAHWDTILLEEVYEALSETDLAKLRAELVQVAAVAVAWIEDIDSRD